MNVDVGDLFMGAVTPGILLVLGYLLYIKIRLSFASNFSPAGVAFADDRVSVGEFVKIILAPLLLIISVLGSIMLGIASPTEAASVGAVGAILVTAAKGRLNNGVVMETLAGTTKITAMVFTSFSQARVQPTLGSGADSG